MKTIKPVKAWAISTREGRFVNDGFGVPELFSSERRAARHAIGDERAIPVEIRPIKPKNPKP